MVRIAGKFLLILFVMAPVGCHAGVFLIAHDCSTLPTDDEICVSASTSPIDAPVQIKESFENEMEQGRIESPSSHGSSAIIGEDETQSFGSTLIDLLSILNDPGRTPPDLDGLIKPPQKSALTADYLFAALLI